MVLYRVDITVKELDGDITIYDGIHDSIAQLSILEENNKVLTRTTSFLINFDPSKMNGMDITELHTYIASFRDKTNYENLHVELKVTAV